MTNTLITPDQLAAVAASLVGADLNLAATTYLDLAADFGDGSGSRVRVRIPGAPQAHSRGLYDVSTPLVTGSIAEQGIDVELTDHAYSDVALAEGDLDLSIVDFSRQVLVPQALAVSKFIERAVAAAMKATPLTTITFDAANPAKAFTAARAKLRSNGLPASARLIAAVGANVYGALLDGPTTTFDDSGKVRGFELIESTRLGADEAVCYTPAAFATVVRAPRVPAGASFGASVKGETFALRYIRNYDSSVAADRSLVSAFVGVQPMPIAVDREDGTVDLVDDGGAIRFVTA